MFLIFVYVIIILERESESNKKESSERVSRSKEDRDKMFSSKSTFVYKINRADYIRNKKSEESLTKTYFPKRASTKYVKDVLDD